MADISKRKEAEQNSEKDQDKDCHQHKKRKTENESSVIEPLSSFEGFKIGKVLSENAQSKTLFLQGKQIVEILLKIENRKHSETIHSKIYIYMWFVFEFIKG